MGNISNNNIGGSITGVDYYSVIGVINTNNDVTYPTQSITGFNLPTVSPTQSGWVMVTQGTTTLGWTNSISGSVSQNLTQVLAVGATANSWINLGQSYGVRETGATGSSVLFDSSRLFLSTGDGSNSSGINLYKNGLLQLESSNGVDGCILTISDGTHSYGTGTVYFDGTSGRGIQYYSDYSTNYTNRSLVDKEYVDTKVSGATGSTSLANVLSVGATASTSINMNSNNITGISSLGNESETTIEMINIINMSLLTLMYNT